MKKILKWLSARAKEPSTYAGVAVIASIAGAPEVGQKIGQVGSALALILGGGLIAHPSAGSTSN